MRYPILFFLLAGLAFSLISASKESGHQPGRRHPPRRTEGPAVEAPKRVKRFVRLHPNYYYTPYAYGRPYYSVPAFYI